MKVLLCALLVLLLAPVAAREFDVRREPSLHRTLLAGNDSQPQRSWGLSWHLEFRAASHTVGPLIAFGTGGLFRISGEIWGAPSFSFVVGGVAASNASTGLSPESIRGVELHTHFAYYAARWRNGAFCISGGPSIGYFDGSSLGDNAVKGTLDIGPTLLLGVELGQRVRAVFDSGVTAYRALNYYDAGWIETGHSAGPVGLHITILRFSLRWYS